MDTAWLRPKSRLNREFLMQSVYIALRFFVKVVVNTVHNPSNQQQTYSAFSPVFDNLLDAGLLILFKVKSLAKIVNLKGDAFLFIYFNPKLQTIFRVTLVRVDH